MKTCPADLSIAFAAIQFVVARYHVTLAEIESPTRAWRIAWPRFLAIDLCHRHAHLGYRKLGYLFNRFPSAMLHACRAVETATQTNCRSAREVAAVESEFMTFGLRTSIFTIQPSDFGFRISDL